MRHPLRLLMLLALLTTLGGCYTARGATTIGPEGSGTQTLIVAFEDELGLLSPDELDSLKEQVIDSGGDVRDWSEGSYSGFEATWSFEQPEQLSELLTGRAAQLYTLDLSIDERDGNRVYTFRNMVDPAAVGSNTLDPSMGLPGLEMPGLDFPGLMQPDLRYKLTLPGKITSYRPESGRLVGENSIEWTLEPGDIIELEAVSEVPLPQTWIPFAVAGGLALLALGAGMVVFFGRRRMRVAPVLPAEALEGGAPAAAPPAARTGPLPEPRPTPRVVDAPPRGVTPMQVAGATEPSRYDPPGDLSKGTPTMPLSSFISGGSRRDEPGAPVKTGRLCRHCDRANPAGVSRCQFCGNDLSTGNDLA